MTTALWIVLNFVLVARIKGFGSGKQNIVYAVHK